MDFIAKVIMELPVESGIGKSTGREWKKRGWVLETFGQYPRKVKVDAFGATADSLNIEVGKVYNVSVDLESREFNGRWYSDIKVYAVRETADPSFGGAQAPVQTTPAADPFASNAADPFAAASAAGAPGADAFAAGGDDLPF